MLNNFTVFDTGTVGNKFIWVCFLFLLFIFLFLGIYRTPYSAVINQQEIFLTHFSDVGERD